MRALQNLVAFYLCSIIITGCSAEAELPTIVTGSVTEIGTSSAHVNSTVTDDGGAPIQSRGVCYGYDAQPSLESNSICTSNDQGTGGFIAELTGLDANAEYRVRAYATNEVGISYGDVVGFTTISGMPTVTTNPVTSILASTAISGGSITNDGGQAVVDKGVCWSVNPTPLITDNSVSSGAGSDAFICSLTGLQASTVYYVRAYASNSIGTSYGNEISFSTNTQASIVTDIDGNTYSTILLGNGQEWMVENLKTTRYNNGDSIVIVSDPGQWGALLSMDLNGPTSAAACYYNGDELNGSIYGLLYNWFAVADSRKVCPVGWHVPSNIEWSSLHSLLGGSDVSGGKLKQAGTQLWSNPNVAATDEVGFSALPGGVCFGAYIGFTYEPAGPAGTFGGLGDYGFWWSSTSSNLPGGAKYTVMYHENSSALELEVHGKWTGMSVRCVKD